MCPAALGMKMYPQSHPTEYNWEVQLPRSRPWLWGRSHGIDAHGILPGSAQGSAIVLVFAPLEMGPSRMHSVKSCSQIRKHSSKASMLECALSLNKASEAEEQYPG